MSSAHIAAVSIMQRGDDSTFCRVDSQTFSHRVREGLPLARIRITLTGRVLLISIFAMEILGEDCEGRWRHLRATRNWSAVDYRDEYLSLKKSESLSVRTQ